jgi:hypothetical protein
MVFSLRMLSVALLCTIAGPLLWWDWTLSGCLLVRLYSFSLNSHWQAISSLLLRGGSFSGVTSISGLN